MPNNTENTLEVSGDADKVAALRDRLLITGEDGNLAVDFNAYMPMPESLRVECGSNGEQAYVCLYGTDAELQRLLNYAFVQEAGITEREALTKFLEERAMAHHKEGTPTWRELGETYARNIREHGHPTWYEWCNANWGTKWNAYSTEVLYDEEGYFVVRFDTAWSPPMPVYAAIANTHQDLRIHAYWSDEGSYARELVFANSGL